MHVLLFLGWNMRYDKNLPNLSDRKFCDDSENAIENFVKFIFHSYDVIINTMKKNVSLNNGFFVCYDVIITSFWPLSYFLLLIKPLNSRCS